MNQYKGFTLIELMITVAIMSIMMAVGLPSFQSIIASSRLTSATNSMVSALQLARFEAVKQHKVVIVRPKNGIADNWKNGWEVFVDLNGNNAFDTGVETILGKFDALGSTLTVKSTYSGSTTDKIGYEANGRAKQGSFTFCSGTDFRKVVVYSTGRVHLETPTSC